MTWQIFAISGKGRVPVRIDGTQGETESATIIAYLKSRGLNATWWSKQKTYSCRRVK